MSGAESRVASLVRWRAGLALAAVFIPLSLFLLIERQARRLDALAARGTPVEARVTAVAADNSATFYVYRVNAVEHSWDVARADAPFALGETFPAVYLPEDPSLSRPIADRSLARHEAARNRSFAWKACFGVAAFLGLCAGLVHRDLRRLRSDAPSANNDPQAYQRRLRVTLLTLLPIFLVIGGLHFQDARERGESVAPGLVGLALCAGIVGGVFYFAGRAGPVKAQAQSARILRWVVPIAAGIALLRLVALLWGR